MLADRVLRILDLFVPTSIREETDVYRARVFVAFAMNAMGIGLLYVALFYFGLGVDRLSHVAVAMFCCYGINLVYFNRTASFRTAANLFGAIGLSAITFTATITGGTSTDALLWSSVIPMTVTMLAGYRLGILWTGIPIVIICVLYSLEVSGNEFTDILTAGESTVFHFVTLIAVHVIVMVSCLCYEILRIQAKEEALEERALVANVYDVHEVERKLFAYDIHDGMMPLLTAAVMQIDLAREQSSVGQEDMLDAARRLVSDTMKEARRIMSGLRPPVLDELGIGPAIEFLIHEAQGVEITYHSDVTDERYLPIAEASIFRICQEALTNIKKHSQARRVHVELELLDCGVQLSVSDDGVGFDVEKIDRRRYGLRGMRERAKLLGGEIVITSSPGNGANVKVSIPLQPTSASASDQ